MKYYQKNHPSEGKSLSIELENNEVTITISSDEGRKEFKLETDEARSLKDALKNLIKKIDEDRIKELNITQEFEIPTTYPAFDAEETQKNKEKNENPNKMEYYY